MGCLRGYAGRATYARATRDTHAAKSALFASLATFCSHTAQSTRSPRPKTPHSVMGIVEVKDTEQHCFYRAKLLDVKQDNCLVQYEEAEGSTTRQAQSWVHSKLVRREPPEQSAVRIEQVPLSAASLWTRHCASPSCHPAPPPLSAQRCRSAACHPHPVRA